MNKAPCQIRAARLSDVAAIAGLLDMYAGRGVVLRRDEDDIRFFLANFVVAEVNGTVCGCAAARDFGNDLLEVRSLVVSPELQGRGIGRALVAAIIAGLRATRPRWRLFTLTGQPGFFLSLGFRRVVREHFPEKIWSDCVQCPKNSCCDEIALLMDFPVAAAECR